MMKNILLTGSGGFIGKHLKLYLQHCHLFTPRSAELNLLDEKAVRQYLTEHKIDFIIHSASCGVRIRPDATLEEVATPNIAMFNHLAQSQIPMITFGSGAEYDKRQSLHLVSEEDFDKSIPQDPYGYSKYLISKQIEKLDHVLNLRLFGIYGIGEDPSRVTHYILQQISKKEPIRLRQNVVFDFLYIDDFCRIVTHFTQHFPTEKFINAVPTESIATVDLAKRALKELHVDLPVFTEQEGFNKEYTASNRRLLNYLPDFKFTSYTQGMTEYYKQLFG